MHIDAFILIGGRSSRLGREKALVEVGGKSLMTRAVEAIRAGLGCGRITLVAGNTAQSAITAVASDIPFILDLHEGRGPIGGIHAALEDASTPWIFVLACDYPFIGGELIAQLGREISDDFGCVLPEQEDGRLQPLCAFYNVGRSRRVVEEIVERPRTTPPMHEVVRQLGPRIVKYAEFADLDGAERFFVNVNTEADVELAKTRILDSDKSKPHAGS